MSAVLWFSPAGTAATDDGESLSNQLQKVVESVDTPADADDQEKYQSLQALALVSQIRGALADGNYSEMLRRIDSALPALPQKAQKPLSDLRQEVKRRMDHVHQATQQRVARLLEQQGQKLQEAAAPEDVDAVLRELHAVSDTVSLQDRDLQATARQLSTAINVAAKWQEFLAYQGNPNPKTQSDLLSSVMRDLAGLPGFLPRSHVAQIQAGTIQPAGATRREPGQPAGERGPGAAHGEPLADATDRFFEETFARVTPDQIVAKWGEFTQRKFESKEAQTLRQDPNFHHAAALEQAMQAYQRKDHYRGLQILQNPRRSHPVPTPALAKLEDRIRVLLCAGALGIAPPTDSKPESGNASMFLGQQYHQALAEGAWRRAVQIGNLLGTTGSSDRIATVRGEANDRRALDSLIDGENLEMAGLKVDAFASYSNALRLAENPELVAPIAAKLRRLQEEEPEIEKKAKIRDARYRLSVAEVIEVLQDLNKAEKGVVNEVLPQGTSPLSEDRLKPSSGKPE